MRKGSGRLVARVSCILFALICRRKDIFVQILVITRISCVQILTAAIIATIKNRLNILFTCELLLFENRKICIYVASRSEAMAFVSIQSLLLIG